jgi:hypothetical protein
MSASGEPRETGEDRVAQPGSPARPGFARDGVEALLAVSSGRGLP